MVCITIEKALAIGQGFFYGAWEGAFSIAAAGGDGFFLNLLIAKAYSVRWFAGIKLW
jgi:hypothetical protein